MSGGEPKISYDRWVYGKALMERLRTEGGFSLTEVSRIACGNGGTPGWADNAREHRSIMREHQIRNMEQYLNGQRSRGVPAGDARLSAAQGHEYSKLIDRLRTVYGWDNAQVGSALNIAPTTVSHAVTKRVGTVAKLQVARAIVAQLDRAARNGKLESAAPAPAASVTLPPPPSSRGLLGTALSAGESFVEALGKLEAEMPPFARKAARELRERAQVLVAELSDGGAK